MTFREKITMERPDMLDDSFAGGVSGCPYTYGYEDITDRLCGSGETYNCTACWDREMPGSEVTPGAMNYKDEYERVKRMFEELCDKYRNMEECAKSWENEAECRGESNYELRIKNDKLKAIVRTVEVLTGGKILDE